MNILKALTATTAAFALLVGGAQAQEASQRILFTHANVFDGSSSDLIMDANVLVEGNVITQVSTNSIDAGDAKVIDATGKYLTPGLIDMHTHSV